MATNQRIQLVPYCLIGNRADLPETKTDQNFDRNLLLMVSIVITGFFCGDLLGDAIRSLQMQCDSEWRCAVVFDPDEQGSLVKELTNNDERFKLMMSAPLNVSAARNCGFSELAGEFLISLDGDDCISPQYIATLRRILETRNEIAVAYTGTRYFGLINGLKQEFAYSRRLLAVRNMIVSSAMFRRKDFVEVGGYDEKLTEGYEDWEFWIAILKRGGEVAFDPNPHFMYRQRPGSRSRQMTEETQREAKNYIFQKHRDFCWHSNSLLAIPKD